MIEFLTISIFRNEISELSKVRRNVYGGVENEIYRQFIDSSIEQIRNNRDMVLIEGDSVIIKLRLPDKKHRLSKKDGYRLIYLVSKTKNSVTFLTVYPKNGPNQRIGISNDELKSLLSCYLDEAAREVLEPFARLS